MRSELSRLTGIVCLGVLFAPEVRAEPPILFETHILPILETRCLRCHGDKHKRGGLDLRRKFTMIKGGDNGTSLVPGKSASSLLVTRVSKGEMPPAKEERLSPRHVELLRRWVDEGAKLANPKESPLDESVEVTRNSEQDRAFWAFQPPKQVAPPQVRATDRVRTPIDAFLLAKLQTKGLEFAPDSPREVLLRRLYFDLIGLPPTPEQRAEFLNDHRPDAYEHLVERLLASPFYGERWGRHWLDVAGYADSDGYLAADRLRTEAWRYRDYVIRAFNSDMPYSQFLTEQLAGDEMSDWRRADALTPLMERQLTATGFLRTALDPTYPGYTEPNEIHQVLNDTMEIVSSTWLGLTIQCARCHAHKFDPVSQRDYYSMRAIFVPALDPVRWQPSSVRGISLASEPQFARRNARNSKIDARVKELNSLSAESLARFRKLSGNPKATVKALSAKYPEFQTEQSKLSAAITAELALKQKTVLLRGLADLPGKPPEAKIFRRGDYSKPGASVESGVPEVLASKGFRFEPEEQYKTTGRRLAFARWLARPDHPLTARVQVNRMWAHLFGRGIVPTVANFGRSGAKPTHPELLDWLAVEFIDQGWSTKRLHRMMVLSTAYRQSSEPSPKTREFDPKNDLLGSWRPRRHEGEVVRDSILSVAGKLTDQRFGPPAPVKMNGDGSVETNDDPQGNRRSIYLIVRRSQHLTLLDVFDTPMMEVNCPERVISTVPMQPLALLNGPFARRNARALGARLLASSRTDEKRIEYAYGLLFARDVRPSERAKIEKFLGSLRKAGEPEPTVWAEIALVLLNSNEFVYVH